MSACAVAKRTQKALRNGSCEPVYRPLGPTCSVFIFHLSMRVDSKTRVFWGRPENEPFAPDVPVYARLVVCGTSITPE